MEGFEHKPDKMRIFIPQWELFMGTWAAEFLMDHTRVFFVLSLLKEFAAKWTLPVIENNDLVMDNYQNFMDQCMEHKKCYNYQPLNLSTQGRQQKNEAIYNLFQVIADTDWNEMALID